MALVFPSSYSVWWSPALLRRAAHLPAHGEWWRMPYSASLVCVAFALPIKLGWAGRQEACVAPWIKLIPCGALRHRTRKQMLSHNTSSSGRNYWTVFHYGLFLATDILFVGWGGMMVVFMPSLEYCTAILWQPLFIGP